MEGERRERKETIGTVKKKHFPSKSFQFWRDLVINRVKGTNHYKSLPSQFMSSNLAAGSGL